MDDRLPGGSPPPVNQGPDRPTRDAGERAAEAERQAAAESASLPTSQQEAAMPSAAPAAMPDPASASPAAGVPEPAPAGSPTAADPTPPVRPEWDDDGLDMAFSPTLPEDAVRFGEASPVPPICQWCNARLPAPDVAKCPTCGVRLRPAAGTTEVPGLTTPTTPYRPAPGPAVAVGASLPGTATGQGAVPGWPGSARPAAPQAPGVPRDASVYEGLTPEEIQMLSNSSATLRHEISQLNSREALEPPSRDVRQAMLEIEFEADRADPMRIVDPGPLSERRTLEPPV